MSDTHLAKPHTFCDECDAGPFLGDRGLRMHKTRTHGKASALGEVVRLPRRARKRQTTTERLAAAVQLVFPKGIPTDDMDKLTLALAIIDTMREAME